MTTHSLTVYRLKSHIESIDDALRDPEAVRRHAFQIDGREGIFIAKPSDPHPPDWLPFIQPISGGLLDDARVSVAFAVAFIPIDDRWFALPFGYGRSLLQPYALEQNFGLRVAVNAVDPTKLRAVDALSLDSIALNQRRQTGKATGLIDFDMDVERNMLLAATGEPKDRQLLGKKVSGKDSIRLTRAITWDKVPALLRGVSELHESDEYKKSFGWIDHLSQVRDPALEAELDKELDDRMASGDHADIALTLPAVVDWSEIQGFRYQKPRQGELHADVSWEGYLSSLPPGVEPSVSLSRNQTVLGFAQEDAAAIHDWPIYQCLYCEFGRGDAIYVLSNGTWHRVDKDYVARIDSYVGSVPTATISCPDYLSTHLCEDDYIDAAEAHDKPMYARMHKRMIYHGGGHSQIEFCDLYSAAKQLIHIKRCSGSSDSGALGHLFSQGVASSRLMLEDPEFRRKVNLKIHDDFAERRFDPTDERPHAYEWEIVYLMLHSTDKTNTTLPLFSRLSLRNAAAALRSMGVKVSTLHLAQA